MFLSAGAGSFAADDFAIEAQDLQRQGQHFHRFLDHQSCSGGDLACSRAINEYGQYCTFAMVDLPWGESKQGKFNGALIDRATSTEVMDTNVY